MDRKTEEPQEASNSQIDSDVEGNDENAEPSHQHNDSLVSDNVIAFANQDMRDPDPVDQNLNTNPQISQDAQEFDNEFTSRYYQSIYANGTMGSGGINNWYLIHFTREKLNRTTSTMTMLISASRCLFLLTH